MQGTRARRRAAGAMLRRWCGAQVRSGVARVSLPPARWCNVRRLSDDAGLGELKKAAAARLSDVVEVQQRDAFEKMLQSLREEDAPAAERSELRPEAIERMVKAGFATFCLHVEARVASFLGKGFYTIGPCGEELMAVLGELCRLDDAVALHYRHVAVQVARQLKAGRSMEDVLLDRARGYVVSKMDPVTGGHHCALGGGPHDFYVTSTLASQSPPAVGRALGIRLASRLLEEPARRFPKDAISVVSLGDGSVNNSMFLSALNMSTYAKHRGFKCPVLFVVSNNDVCISLRGYGYLKTFTSNCGVRLFEASGAGSDLDQLFKVTDTALQHVRKSSNPALLVVNDLPRRFGHAATDRQARYLTAEEIQTAAATNPLEKACRDLVSRGSLQPQTLWSWWQEIRSGVESAFEAASAEPKLDDPREVMERLRSPVVDLDPAPGHVVAPGKPQPMRVLMNSVFKEAMEEEQACVYIGEDVRHGGYYRVTEDLAEQFPDRVQDVPPDETSLLGIGIGYAQAGLLPIVEIPYAKYLDCGADMFFEAVMTHWCTNGRQRDGMLIRLQGFDKGVFGGNFHTHNSLYLPPGLDVVCYSNGADYVRGMRYCMGQVKHAGRVVMSVDSTDLLHRRSLFSDSDSLWLTRFPDQREAMLDFETVVLFDEAAVHGGNPLKARIDVRDVASLQGKRAPDAIVFTFGNGVPTCLRAAKELPNGQVWVVDCPTVGRLAEGMRAVLRAAPRSPIVLADVCKRGQNPFATVVVDLQAQGLLDGRQWQCVAAWPTYNPLGSTCTFLQDQDVLDALLRFSLPSNTHR